MDAKYESNTESAMNISIFNEYPDVVGHSDLCAMLGISKNTAYGLLKSGKIRCRRIGRIYKIPKQEVIGFLSQNS